ncbi:ABC transporter permease [Faecalicatena sp. AGMB00832]|uniref:ABC transporter permease n=1 Tax=Faecalicatena faecalis TaxID=2726362 RepID=A0ABS6D7E9_9FIRM|nr:MULTISPECIES: ABC transporter permease [Faecalicatena]MBU3877441.1 ABC transporter permease [Faecalicatena faecalis]MCI6465007.1 ABC transporter permease [Faecalicatena sp.]MDY5617162.1 ABC transporter permease [Lachnospiraceae bacterium]
MTEKRCGRRLIVYEIRNVLGNPFIYMFGIVFPVLMFFLIIKTVQADVPESAISQANTAVFITMTLMIPMAVVLLGYSSNYSQELEKEIPLRMKLFGYPEKSVLLAKIIAQFVVMAAGLVIYTAVAYASVEMETPRVSSALCLILCLFLLSGIYFALAHGVATIFKKFGAAYVVMMTVFFGSMILCGMMGIKVDQLPTFAQKMAALLPMSYISSDFIDFWTEGSYNFAPLIQSFLFTGAVSGIVLLIAVRREYRKITSV